MGFRWRRAAVWLCALALAVGAVLSGGQPVRAAVVYTYNDESSSLEIDGTQVQAFGEHVVWKGSAGTGEGEIYYGNTRTNKTIKITNHGKGTDSPAVGVNGKGEVVVVWADYRNIKKTDNVLCWDIYSYNLSTKVETKLNSTTEEHRNPSISGDYIVWQTNPHYAMQFYNMKTGTLTYLGKGINPIVSGDRIVYEGVQDSDLYEYQIDADKHQKVVDLPNREYVSNFVFNGNEILWKQTDPNSNEKYTYIDLGSSNPQPVDLTNYAPRASRVYAEMSVGNGMAVLLVDSGGTDNAIALIKGVDAKTGASFELGYTHPKRFAGFNGNKLELVSEGRYVSRGIVRTEIASSGPASPEANESYSVGPDGGTAGEGQEMSLKFVPGTFDKSAQISFEKIGSKDITQLISSLSWTGISWKWTSSEALHQPATLTFTLKQPLDQVKQANRIGIYRYDGSSSSWVYAGGQVDESRQSIHTQVREPGIYGLFIYDPLFVDMENHWAKSAVSVLASKWIVNGIGNKEFAPAQQVTRAEFAKMLVQASGLEVKKPGELGSNPTFKDVPANHWAYPWIEQAYEAGWIKGYEGNQFKPNAVVTREEMMVMLANAAGLTKEEDAGTLSAYSDDGKVHAWAKASVQSVIKQGIIQGNAGHLNPGETSTRAEAATVIYRWLEMRGELFHE